MRTAVVVACCLALGLLATADAMGIDRLKRVRTTTRPECTAKPWPERMKCSTYYHGGLGKPLAPQQALDRLQLHVARDPTAFDGLMKGSDVPVKAANTANAAKDKPGNAHKGTRFLRRLAKEFAIHVNSQTGETAIVSASTASAPVVRIDKCDVPVVTMAHSHPYPHPDYINTPWPVPTTETVKWYELFDCDWNKPYSGELLKKLMPSAADVGVITRDGNLDKSYKTNPHEHWLLTPYRVHPTTHVLYDPLDAQLPGQARMLSFTLSQCALTGAKVNGVFNTPGTLDESQCLITAYAVEVNTVAHTVGERKALGTVTKVGGIIHPHGWGGTCSTKHRPVIQHI